MKGWGWRKEIWRGETDGEKPLWEINLEGACLELNASSQMPQVKKMPVEGFVEKENFVVANDFTQLTYSALLRWGRGIGWRRASAGFRRKFLHVKSEWRKQHSLRGLDT